VTTFVAIRLTQLLLTLVALVLAALAFNPIGIGLRDRLKRELR
jgi:ABC-type dipeptide/oligopeptide/nickel transport system permease subunit